MSHANSALTERELEILAALVDGLSNQEIANTIHLSLKTVKWYNTQIFGKLGVTSRQQAIEQAQKLKLLGPAQSLTDIPNNLPEQPNPFIGREADLHELTRLLVDPEIRCVTISGPGGIGKTRLSLQTGRQLLSHFSDGVFFVKLASVRNENELLDAVAQLFQLQQSDNIQDDLLASITHYLHSKTTLLILDNFEHLLPDSAEVITNLLQNTTHVKILVTSRERLNLQSETVFSMRGLAFPAQPADHDAMHFDAVKLFVQSAAQVRSSYEPHAEEWESIARICHLTEGMPLALVLAAAWTGVMSVAEIAEEIRHSIDFLAVEMRDMPQRQWSMQAVFEATWNRLTAEERAVFMKFAVFRGGCTRRAAQAVTAATPHNLMSLINKSLIWREVEGERYEIHELLRQYAESKLEKSGLHVEAKNAHALYFMTFLAERLEHVRRGEPISVINEITADRDNIVFTLRAQWVWSPENYETVRQAVEALDIYHDIAMYSLAKFSALIEAYPKSPVRQVIEARFLPFRDGGIANIKAILEQARARNDHAEAAICLLNCGHYLMNFLNEREAAAEALQQASDLYRGLGDLYRLGQSLLLLGWACWHDFDRQLYFHVEALNTFEKLGNRVKVAHAYLDIARAYAFTKGDLTEGERYANLGLKIASEAGITRIILHAHNVLGWSAFHRGDFEAMTLHAEVGIHENSGIADVTVHVHPYAILSLAKSMADEDYEAGLRLAEHAKALMDHPLGIIYTVAMSAALLGLGRYSEAVACARQWLKIAAGILRIAPILFNTLAMGRTGHHERAAELLGFCYNYSASNRWMDKWSLIGEIIAELRTQLGNDAYQAAYERGQQFEMDTVTRELLSEV